MFFFPAKSRVFFLTIYRQHRLITVNKFTSGLFLSPLPPLPTFPQHTHTHGLFDCVVPLQILLLCTLEEIREARCEVCWEVGELSGGHSAARRPASRPSVSPEQTQGGQTVCFHFTQIQKSFKRKLDETRRIQLLRFSDLNSVEFRFISMLK